MYRDFLLLLQSAGGGIFSTSIYLLGGHILDYFMNAKYSNFIALIISAVVNFVMQTRTFVGKREVNNNNNIEKYFVSEIIIITLSQLGLIYLINHKKDYTRKIQKKNTSLLHNSCSYYCSINGIHLYFISTTKALGFYLNIIIIADNNIKQNTYE